MEEIMKIGSNLSSSFAYAKDGLFGHWVKWIKLIISTIIFPLMDGYTLKIYRGESPAPDIDDWVITFMDGIKVFIINFVYAIPAIIVGAILGIFVSIILGIVGMLFAIIPVIGPIITAILEVCALFGIPLTIAALYFLLIGPIQAFGLIKFARTGEFGAAFDFNSIIEKIRSIGWLSYYIQMIAMILAFIIVAAVLYLVLSLVLGLVFGIVIGILVGDAITAAAIGGLLSLVLALLIECILSPIFVLWGAKYICNIYDNA